MTLCVEWVKETPKAVQYRREDGSVIWIPRSALGSVVEPMATAEKPNRIRITVMAWVMKKYRKSADVWCECGHVTTFGHTYFAVKTRVACENCARYLESPKLRV